ncbi:hypothetical protein T01_14888 [Trichinella spiralis]|uniref:Uncharacterized protein n=1 Tax=Trichinella spiralis TaxID=6334 RepID=A0A0V1B5J9_TRISP|nr:hypothetical protein T01_14888 [Trichinella spiralis]
MSARRTQPDDHSSLKEEKLLRNDDSPNDSWKNVLLFRGRNNRAIIRIYPKDHAKSCAVDEHLAFQRGTMMKPPPHPPTPLLLASSRFSVVYGLQCTETLSEISGMSTMELFHEASMCLTPELI